MMDQQIVRAAEVDQLAVIARQRFEAVIGRLDENLGLIAGAAQDALNAEHLVADRIAVAERREHLVDADHARLLASEGPVGSAASTSSAGGSSRRRRANQPGSRFMVRAGASFPSRPYMSRDFRSITGQS